MNWLMKTDWCWKVDGVHAWNIPKYKDRIRAYHTIWKWRVYDRLHELQKLFAKTLTSPLPSLTLCIMSKHLASNNLTSKLHSHIVILCSILHLIKTKRNKFLSYHFEDFIVDVNFTILWCVYKIYARSFAGKRCGWKNMKQLLHTRDISWKSQKF